VKTENERNFQTSRMTTSLSLMMIALMLVMDVAMSATATTTTNNVLTLTRNNITMVKDGAAWFVMFHAPWW
jgi:alkaline phosphatase